MTHVHVHVKFTLTHTYTHTHTHTHTEPRSSPSHNEVDEIAIHVGLDLKHLDSELTDDSSLLLSLAGLIPDWHELATSLGLSDPDVQALLTSVHLSYKMKVWY